jgi:predicted transcriptional regulator
MIYLLLNKFPKGNKMSLELKTQVVEIVTSKPCGIRDVIKALNCRTSKAIALLREMEDERLIVMRQETASKRGRPKKIITCTPLGFEFLEAYKKVRMKPLRARKEDLEHAVKDAFYVDRLVARGLSPFRLFMELNVIASNIEESSETAESA